MSIRVTCINKSGGYHQDAHHAIEFLGWVDEQNNKTGRATRLQMYEWVSDKANIAVVVDRAGHRVQIYPRANAQGTKYVQTYADGIWSDNLLALPECP
jgi:hypothetical protein